MKPFLRVNRAVTFLEFMSPLLPEVSSNFLFHFYIDNKVIRVPKNLKKLKTISNVMKWLIKN